MPDRKNLIDASIKLAVMLKAHKFKKSDIEIRLFKAKSLSDLALKNSIR